MSDDQKAALRVVLDLLKKEHAVYMKAKGRDPQKYASQYSIATIAIIKLLPKEVSP